MFEFACSIQTIIVFITSNELVSAGSMPASQYDSETTTCEEFSKFARFSPYSVVDDEWISFYYWGPPRLPLFYTFSVPSTKDKEYLKLLLDGHVIKQIDWSARMLFMIERSNRTFLLVEQNERGYYLLYPLFRGLKASDVVTPVDVRLKQFANGTYFGLFDCKRDLVFVFSRLRDIPRKDDLIDVAAMLGYRGRGGKTYLYQGHQWMPIPEADEEEVQRSLKRRSAPMRRK